MDKDSLRLLKELGWDNSFQEKFQLVKMPGSVPGRVVSESKGSYQVNSQYGELTAKQDLFLRWQVLSLCLMVMFWEKILQASQRLLVL